MTDDDASVRDDDDDDDYHNADADRQGEYPSTPTAARKVSPSLDPALRKALVDTTELCATFVRNRHNGPLLTLRYVCHGTVGF